MIIEKGSDRTPLEKMLLDVIEERDRLKAERDDVTADLDRALKQVVDQGLYLAELTRSVALSYPIYTAEALVPALSQHLADLHCAYWGQAYSVSQPQERDEVALLLVEKLFLPVLRRVK